MLSFFPSLIAMHFFSRPRSRALSEERPPEMSCGTRSAARARPRRPSWVAVLSALGLTSALLSGCGDGSGPSGGSGGSSAGIGGSSSGGTTASGGAALSGGAPAAGGGIAGASSGTGGQAEASGGAGSGGADPSGSGGSAAGGAPAGGAASGGASTGGAGGQPGSGGTAATGGDGSGGATVAAWPQINGVQWADTEGNPIQAHGGGVLKVGDDYYWFGENRNADGSFFAVSAYRSRDLKQWEFRHHVLQMTSDPELKPANVERPKVVFNEATGKFVMWMHWENGKDYGEARAAVASSDTVDGDYTYHGSFRPYASQGVTDHGKPGYMSRDCNLFVDDDGTGYFVSATNENSDLNLYQLTADYLQVDSLAATLFKGGHREAPALFKRKGVYFLVSSAATGWDPNQGQYATSTNLKSGWSSQKNVGDGTTYYSQSTYVLEVSGGGESNYLYLGDRWAGAYGGKVNDSTYLWQPISFSGDTQMSMKWDNVLDLDARVGKVAGSVEHFVLTSKKSGLVLDVAGASTANNADIIQSTPTGAPNQRWAFDYNARGHFQLVNEKSSRVIDVPDESTADGVALIQYDDHDGDNQGWRVIDLGRGEFQLRNQKSQKLLTVVGGSTSEGAAIEQRTAGSGDEQIWLVSVAE